MKLNCFIVDDEPLARKCIRDYVQQTNYLIYAGEAGSAEEAAKLLQEIKADIIFTDIQMPGISGIDFVRAAGNESLFVFITAFPEYALEGNELIKIANYEIPLSRHYRADVMNKVIGNNLLKR